MRRGRTEDSVRLRANVHASLRACKSQCAAMARQVDYHLAAGHSSRALCRARRISCIRGGDSHAHSHKGMPNLKIMHARRCAHIHCCARLATRSIRRHTFSRTTRTTTTKTQQAECAKLIIQSGIRQVVYLGDKYHDKKEFVASRRLLDMAGVVYRCARRLHSSCCPSSFCAAYS